MFYGADIVTKRSKNQKSSNQIQFRITVTGLQIPMYNIINLKYFLSVLHYYVKIRQVLKVLLTLFSRPLAVYFCGTVLNCQSRFEPQKYVHKAGTSVSKGGSGPASRRRTVTQGSSVSRLTMTEPDAPPPTKKKIIIPCLWQNTLSLILTQIC